MTDFPNIMAGLDLAAALAARILSIVSAAQATGGTRDLTSDELQPFVDADDAARDRLQAKIDQARIEGR